MHRYGDIFYNEIIYNIYFSVDCNKIIYNTESSNDDNKVEFFLFDIITFFNIHQRYHKNALELLVDHTTKLAGVQKFNNNNSIMHDI